MVALRLSLLALWLSTSLTAQDDTWLDALRGAESDLRRGKLGVAENAFEEIITAAAEDPEDEKPKPEVVVRARQGLLELHLIRGEYREVQEQLETLPAPQQREPAWLALGARAAQATGNYQQALTAWTQLAAQGDAVARFHAGQVHAELGQRDAARAAWQAAADAQQRAPSRDARQLAFAAKCLIELGGRSNLELASQWLVESVQIAPELPQARTTRGLLEFAVYAEAAGFPSGENNLLKVLELNGEVEEALIGLYRIRASNFLLDPDKTESFLDRALGVNPRSVPALLERGIGLVQDRRFEEAATMFEQALEVNPRNKTVLAHRAAVATLLHDEAGAERWRAQALDATFAGSDQFLADHLVALYRFRDAIPYYRKALAQSPDDPAMLHGLAKALIYTAQGEEARSVLARAKELQPGFVNPWRNNALAVEELLAKDYQLVERGGFLVKMHEDDLGVLVDYLLPVVEEARRVLGDKYGHVPDQPVTLEVFHTWSDFSVRTIGYRGFQALGACFGPLITLVSPVDADIRRQDFMWSATVWHEYAHVLTLALSKHRVPRWLTEGFSVYEERARNPSWERGMERDLLNAYHNGDIVPVRLLNRLFRGPRILFGYYQGGLMVEFLAEQHGFAKVVEFLRGFGDDQALEALFEQVFGMPSSTLDQRFLRWVRDVKLKGVRLVPKFSDGSVQRLQTRLAKNPDDLEARVNLGMAYAQRGMAVDAAGQVRLVLAKQPQHPQGLLLHAELLRQRRALEPALEAYRAGFAAGADDFDARIRCSEVLTDLQDLDGAIEQLYRAKACWPQCTEPGAAELRLVRALRQADRGDEATVELKAFIRRTGRAFQPRLELAEIAGVSGDHAEEAQLLEEAVAIDPFMRELHVRLATAYEKLGKPDAAVRELRVALAVLPELDRAYLGKPKTEIPERDAASEREARAAIWVSLARMYKLLNQDPQAREALDRAERESPDGDAASEAQQLRDAWGW